MPENNHPLFDFSAAIADLARDFAGRQWVLDAIDHWLADPQAPAVFIITGEPGIGKSAIAARLIQGSAPTDPPAVADTPRVAAYHLCMARDAQTLDPALFARSLSQQLCRYDAFAASLLADKHIDLVVRQDIRANYGRVIGLVINNLVVNAPSAEEAFTHAVLRPLTALCRGGLEQPLVILVDALDEAVRHQGPRTIVDLLANAGEWPRPVRLILTSRLEGAALRHFGPARATRFLLDAESPDNLADIRRYVRERLASSAELQARLARQGAPAETLARWIADKSEGSFLYGVWVLRGIAAGTQPFDRPEALPQGLAQAYLESLRTRCTADLRAWRGLYRPVMGALAAAQAPLSRAQVRQFSALSAQDARDALDDLMQFADPRLAEQGTYQIHHQSVIDLLTDEAKAGEFYIDPSPAHARIAMSYADLVQAQGGDWSACDAYGLSHTVSHLMWANLPDDLLARELHRVFTPSYRAARERRAGWQSPYLGDVARIAARAPRLAAKLALDILLHTAEAGPNSYVSQGALKLLVALRPTTGPLDDTRSSAARAIDAAVALLSQQPRPADGVARLRALLAKTSNTRVRGVLAVALGETGDREAAPTLLRLLRTGAYQERWGAADALIVLNDRSIIADLVAWYGQALPHCSDRERVLYILGWMHADEARALQADGLASRRAKNVGRALELMVHLSPAPGDAEWLMARLHRIVQSDPRRPQDLGVWKDEWLQKRLVATLRHLNMAAALPLLQELRARVAARGQPASPVKRANLIEAIDEAASALAQGP